MNFCKRLRKFCRFDLVVFTASMEVYGTHVADKLDNGRGILNRRWVSLGFLIRNVLIVGLFFSFFQRP